MTLQAIGDGREIRDAVAQLEEIRGATTECAHQLGLRWQVVRRSDGYHVSTSRTGGVRLSINFAAAGATRNKLGLLARDRTGRRHLLRQSRDKSGAGQPQIIHDVFEVLWPGPAPIPVEEVEIAPETPRSWLRAGCLDDDPATFVRDLAQFLDWWRMLRLRANARGIVGADGLSGRHRPRWRFGSYLDPGREPTEITPIHDAVVRALRGDLEQLNLSTDWNQYIDLMAFDGGRITHLFEVKSSPERASVYKAVGQLVLNQLNLEGAENARLVLVIPDSIINPLCQLVRRLGIAVLRYYIPTGEQSAALDFLDPLDPVLWDR